MIGGSRGLLFCLISFSKQFLPARLPRNTIRKAILFSRQAENEMFPELRVLYNIAEDVK